MQYFLTFFNALVKYQKEHGDVLVPRRYVIDNYRLGRVVGNVRDGRIQTTEDERALLNSIGFAWKVRVKPRNISFEELFLKICEYYKTTGTVEVPYDYITDDGISLGHIISNIKHGKRNIKEEEILQLKAIGIEVYG